MAALATVPPYNDPEVILALVAFTNPLLDSPAAAPSKVKSSVPTPSGLIVMTPFDVFGVVMVKATPSTANVPDVD